MKSVLYQSGMQQVWQNALNNQDLGMSLNAMTHSIYTHERDTFQAQIQSDIANMSRLKVYQHLHFEYATSPYVNKVHDRKLRGLMAKLRTGTFPIMVELGRYKGLKPEERLCRHCGVVEDEIHFLWFCERYVEERKDLLETVNIPRIPDSNVDKLCTILDNDKYHVIAKYIYKCLLKRNK